MSTPPLNIKAYYIASPSEQWLKYKAIHDAYVAAALKPPEWLAEYASDETGMIHNLGALARPIKDEDSRGVEIHLDDLPDNATKIRVVWEW